MFASKNLFHFGKFEQIFDENIPILQLNELIVWLNSMVDDLVRIDIQFLYKHSYEEQ